MDVERESVEFLGRVLPHSQELEQAVLGAILQDAQDALPVAMEILTHESFYYPAHQIIFDTLTRLHLRGVPPDPLAVVEELRSRELLERVGGDSYPYAIVTAVPDASAVETHAQVLREKELLRRLISESNVLLKEAYSQEKSVQEILDDAERRILQIDAGLMSGRFSDLDTALREFMSAYEEEQRVGPDGQMISTLKKLRGLDSGYPQLDRLLGGFKRGDLIIVAARPGVGKTALVLNFAHRIATRGKAVGIFSMEMGKEQAAMRLLAMTSGISSSRIDRGEFNREEMSTIRRCYEEMASLPIYIDDSSMLNIRALKNRARRLWAQHQVEIIMVDYLQLMEGMRPGEEGRVQEVTEISRGLKQIARELKIPLIACSQLSRQVEHRSDRKPLLSDLRESGSIEQDADVVIMMYREDYYELQRGEHATSEVMGSVVDLNIAKHRNGPTGQVKLTYLHPYLRFEPYASEDIPIGDYE